MALHHAGVTTDPISGAAVFDPGLLNGFMEVASGDYLGHAVNFELTTLDVSWATTLARAGKPLHFDDSFRNDSSLSDLKDLVCQGYPVIVAVPPVKNCVPQPGLPGGHYVIVTGEHDGPAGSHFDIVDPGCIHGAGGLGPLTTLDAYDNQFVIRGFVEDPPDVSTLEVATDNDAEVQISDADGNKTGFDPLCETEWHEIPRSSYGRDFIADNETGEQSSAMEHSINLFQPTPGRYEITVTGLSLGKYELLIGAFASDGTPHRRYAATGIAGPGSTTSFVVQYSNNNATETVVTCIASFESTLTDVNNSRQLGLLDSPGIANSLTQKLRAAQNAFGPAQVSLLIAFRNEVNAQAGKHITGIAPQVFLRDVNSLLEQLR